MPVVHGRRDVAGTGAQMEREKKMNIDLFLVIRFLLEALHENS